jgi:hypothetical protein
MNVVFDAYHSRNHRHKLGTCRLELRYIRDIIKTILVQVMDLDPARELQEVVQYKMGEGQASRDQSWALALLAWSQGSSTKVRPDDFP